MARVDTVDDYITSRSRWSDEVRTLCGILRSMDLEETVKWGAPCYLRNGRNVVGIVAFSAYFGLWFYEGALLEDARRVLVNAQEGKTRAQRQWRMTAAGDIDEATVRAYVAEAVRLSDDGRSMPKPGPEKRPEPAELTAALAADAGARAAFDRLRPAQRREYSAYVAEAKRADTRSRRVRKILPMIEAGVGLHDRYRR